MQEWVVRNPVKVQISWMKLLGDSYDQKSPILKVQPTFQSMVSTYCSLSFISWLDFLEVGLHVPVLTSTFIFSVIPHSIPICQICHSKPFSSWSPQILFPFLSHSFWCSLEVFPSLPVSLQVCSLCSTCGSLLLFHLLLNFTPSVSWITIFVAIINQYGEAYDKGFYWMIFLLTWQMRGKDQRRLFFTWWYKYLSKNLLPSSLRFRPVMPTAFCISHDISHDYLKTNRSK